MSRTYDECDLAIDKAPNDRLLFNINVSKSIGRGAEISFFVHNVFDDPAIYENCYGTYQRAKSRYFLRRRVQHDPGRHLEARPGGGELT